LVLQNIQSTSNKALRAGDAKTMAILVDSHHKSLQLISTHCTRLEAISASLEGLKAKLTSYVHGRLKNLMEVQRRVKESNDQLRISTSCSRSAPPPRSWWRCSGSWEGGGAITRRWKRVAEEKMFACCFFCLFVFVLFCFVVVVFLCCHGCTKRGLLISNSFCCSDVSIRIQ